MANEYVTQAQVLKSQSLTGTTFASDDVDRAREAASRAVDGYKRTRYWLDTSDTSRYYSPGRYDKRLPIDDLATLTSVLVDEDGDGTYETTWTNGTDFVLNPANANTDGLPFNELELLPQAGRAFPAYPRGVKITGRFGWPAVPKLVEQATLVLAVRWLVRSRNAPLGLVIAEGVEAARLGRLDAEAMGMLDQVPPYKPTLGSLTLG